MEELKLVIAQQYELLNLQRHSQEHPNSIASISEEMVKAEIKKTILERDSLSRWVNSEKDLESLAEKFYHKIHNMPHIKMFADVCTAVYDMHIYCWSLANDYGAKAREADLQPGEFAIYADFGKSDEDAPINELRVLPDHPRKEEVLEKLLSLDSKRRIFAKKYNIFRGHISYLMPAGFSDWRGAVIFANYSHMWSFKSNRQKKSANFMALINAKRYMRFNLTSEEAVRQIKPGAIFQVENVFGGFAAGYVYGDMEKFKELLRYSQLKGAKEYFQGPAQGNLAAFKKHFALS